MTYFRHLWVTEILVHDHTLNKFGVLQPPTHFAFYFDELKVNISPFHVCHGEDSIHSNLSHLSMTAVNTDENTTELFTMISKLILFNFLERNAIITSTSKSLGQVLSLGFADSKGDHKVACRKKCASLFSLTKIYYYFLPLWMHIKDRCNMALRLFKECTIFKKYISTLEVQSRIGKINHPGKVINLISVSCGTYWEVKRLDRAVYFYENSHYSISYRWGMLSFLKAVKYLNTAQYI